MFFQRCEVIRICGKAYDVSEAANISCFNCKMHMCVIWGSICHEGMIQQANLSHDTIMNLSADNYAAYRKETIKVLKEFDQKYINHEMTESKEIGLIHAEAFIPLTDLWEATNDYHKMITDGQDEKPIEDQFIMKLTNICDILATFRQNSEIKEKTYDIRMMLQVLKTDNWKQNKSLEPHLTPLKNAFDSLIEELLRMRTAGVLRSHYFIEKNEELYLRAVHMVEMDMLAQKACLELPADK